MEQASRMAHVQPMASRIERVVRSGIDAVDYGPCLYDEFGRLQG
jgi:hypothetical protein